MLWGLEWRAKKRGEEEEEEEEEEGMRDHFRLGSQTHQLARYFSHQQ